MMKKLFAIIFSLLLFGCQQTQKSVPKTVANVDLARYQGTWYEIARFPNRFEKGCRCVKAQYALQKNRVQVVNSCLRGSPEKMSVARGKAWPVIGSNNSKLKVQFFWPFRGDYWIIYLDRDYKFAVVGDSKRKYLWLLARTPTISANQYSIMLEAARTQGYAVSKLQNTDQNCKYTKVKNHES